MTGEAEIRALIALATRVRQAAYAPYSGFQVGAAVVADDDRVFFGCNVENASYGLSLCAERAAIASAVANGARHIHTIVVVSDAQPPATPCGACRQWLVEVGGPETQVVVSDLAGRRRAFLLRELLPHAFDLHRP